MPGVQFEGLDTLLGIIRAYPQHANGYLMAKMAEVALDVFAESQIQVPVRTGALRGSGSVDISGNEVDIGYGGSAAGYALFVHENLTAHHTPPTKAKFLEDPLTERINKLEPAIAADIDAVVMGSFPQAPSSAQGAAARRATVAHTRGQPTSIAKAKPMTHEEIRSALRSRSRRTIRGA